MSTQHNTGLLSDAGKGRTALAVGGLAAILASACCLGPLVLLALGVSGAWIGNLTALERYRPIFFGVAFVALYFAHRRIYRRAEECAPGEICAVPAARESSKLLFWIVVALLGTALVFPLVAPLLY